MDVESARSFLNFCHEMSRKMFFRGRKQFSGLEFEWSWEKIEKLPKTTENSEFKIKDE